MASEPTNNQTEPVNVASNQLVPPPVIPRPEPPMDRAALLTAVFKARSAAATGSDDMAEQAALDGKTFTFRVRLGCTLQAPGTADAAATWDPETRRVELSARRDLTIADPVAAAIAGDAFEAVEGFWVPDAWVLAPHCGNRGPGGANVAIAQFFTADDPRTARQEGRPYRAREELPEGATPEAGSWDLVVHGRLNKIGDGRVIVCREPTPGAAPACIVSARFDRVEIVNHRTSTQLAEWRAD